MSLIAVWTILICCGIFAGHVTGQQSNGYKCFPALFVFGDDWADTGNARTLYPTDIEVQEESSPYGMTFFRGPAHRLSDGRLMVDFFAQAFDMPLLSSYTTGVVSNLRHGINFAVAGSTASLFNLKVPYPLLLQVQWAQKFQSDVLDALAAGKEPYSGLVLAICRFSGTTQPLPDPSYFQRALYIISTGQNDYRYALLSGQFNATDVEFSVVPQVVENITSSVGLLATNVQAKQFMIMSLPPLGCTPEILTIFASSKPEDYDDKGCLKQYNRVSELHNELLSATIDRLRAVLAVQDATYNITFVDLYSMMSDVLYDPSSSGFAEALQACCGTNEPYNYHRNVICGRQAFIDGMNVSAGPCSSPKDYVSWDGIHMTESFNRYAVNSILQGRYVNPSDAFRCYDDPPRGRRRQHRNDTA